jgi:hypothetical protein
MVRKSALRSTGRRNLQEVRKGCVFGRAAKCTSAESLEIFNDTPLTWFPEEEPKLKT